MVYPVISKIPPVVGRPLASATSAVSRFVPLPFLDDYLRRCTERYVVEKTLRRAGREFDLEQVSQLYKGVGGGGVLAFGRSLVTKGLLFPVRKLVGVARSATGVPRDAMRPLLLGRALSKCLDLDMLSANSTTAIRAGEARAIRTAFEHAFDEAEDELLGRIWTDLKSTAGGDVPELGSWLNLRGAAHEFERIFLDHLDSYDGQWRQ